MWLLHLVYFRSSAFIFFGNVVFGNFMFALSYHLQRDFGDKRVFSERRRNDSYAEEEPEWFSGGPTSQSETIELIGFDDKILEDDKRRSKRSRKRAESLKEGMSNVLFVFFSFQN